LVVRWRRRLGAPDPVPLWVDPAPPQLCGGPPAGVLTVARSSTGAPLCWYGVLPPPGLEATTAPCRWAIVLRRHLLGGIWLSWSSLGENLARLNVGADGNGALVRHLPRWRCRRRTPCYYAACWSLGENPTRSGWAMAASTMSLPYWRHCFSRSPHSLEIVYLPIITHQQWSNSFPWFLHELLTDTWLLPRSFPRHHPRSLIPSSHQMPG